MGKSVYLIDLDRFIITYIDNIIGRGKVNRSDALRYITGLTNMPNGKDWVARYGGGNEQPNGNGCQGTVRPPL